MLGTMHVFNQWKIGGIWKRPQYTDDQLLQAIAVHPVSVGTSFTPEEIDILKNEFLEFYSTNIESVSRKLRICIGVPNYACHDPSHTGIYNLELDTMVQLFGEPDYGTLSFDFTISTTKNEFPTNTNISESFNVINVDGYNNKWAISSKCQESNDWFANRLAFVLNTPYVYKPNERGIFEYHFPI